MLKRLVKKIKTKIDYVKNINEIEIDKENQDRVSLENYFIERGVKRENIYKR